MMIDVSAAPFFIRPGKGIDNTKGLMMIRDAFAGPGKPHVILLFSEGEYWYTDNRWLCGIRSFEIVNGTFRCLTDSTDEAMRRTFFVGEMFQNNPLTYKGEKTYTITDRFGNVTAGSNNIPMLTVTQKYYAGNRVLLYAGNNFADSSYPPPCNGEWRILKDIGAASFNLNLPVERNYRKDVWDNAGIAGGGAGIPRILNLDRSENVYCHRAIFTNVTWGNSVNSSGIISNDGGNMTFPAWELIVNGGVCENYFWPSENKTAIFNDVEVFNTAEFDKLVDISICNRCWFHKTVNGGGSINKIIMNDCYGAEVFQLNPRHLEYHRCHTRTNKVIDGNGKEDRALATLSAHPGQNPMRRVVLNSHTFSSGPDSQATSHINKFPLSRMIITLPGNPTSTSTSIFTTNFDLVKQLEEGKLMFKDDGSDRGIITSITYDGVYHIIAGTWRTKPKVNEVWMWSYVDEVIDMGGHRILGNNIPLWGKESLRWKGNRATKGEPKTMYLTQEDFLWKGLNQNGNVEVVLGANIMSIECFVSDPYSDGIAKIGIAKGEPYAQLFDMNVAVKDRKEMLYNVWAEKLYLSTYDVSGSADPKVLPNMSVIIKWLS